MMIAHHCNLDSRSERMRAPTSGKVDEPVTQSALCALLPRSLFYTNLHNCQLMLLAQLPLKKLKTTNPYEWVKELYRMVKTNGDFPQDWNFPNLDV